jgi:hypothetical protein
MTRVPVSQSEKTQTMTANDFLLEIGFKNEEINLQESNVDKVIISPDGITFSMYNSDVTVTFTLTTTSHGDITEVKEIQTSTAPFTIQFYSGNNVDTVVRDERKNRRLLLADEFKFEDTFYNIHISRLFKEIIETY